MNPESLEKKSSHNIKIEHPTSDWLNKPLKKETRGWMEKKKL